MTKKIIITIFALGLFVAFIGAIILLPRDVQKTKIGEVVIVDDIAEEVEDIIALPDVEEIYYSDEEIQEALWEAFTEKTITQREYSQVKDAYEQRIKKLDDGLITYNDLMLLVKTYDKMIKDSGGIVVLTDINKDNTILDRFNERLWR